MSNSKRVINMDKFWLDDFSVLYENYNFLKFIPMPNMNRIEQLNAITRLMFYTIIIMLLCSQNEELLYIPIAIIVLTVLVYNIFVNNKRKNAISNINNEIINIKRDDDDILSVDRLQIDDMQNIVTTRDSPVAGIDNGLSRNVLTKDGRIVGLEAGYIDSEGDIITGRRYSPFTNPEITDCQRSNSEKCSNLSNLSNSSFSDSFGNYINDNNCCNTPKKPNNSMLDCCTGDENISLCNENISLCNKNVGDNSFQCREPILENPFMNPTITDYNTNYNPMTTSAVVPCNEDDEEIKDDIRVNFNHNLFRDVEDIWEKENSQRQFYTLPNTGVPNNREGFQNWLFGNMPSGKNVQSRGSIHTPYYENLKYKR